MQIDDATNPLIWTAQGYVREQDMRHTVEWELHTRLVNPPRWQFWKMGVGHAVMSGMTCVHKWYLGDVMVKESRDAYQAEGVPGMGQTEEIAA